MKIAKQVYCEGHSTGVYSTSFRYRREVCVKECVNAGGIRVKGCWGVRSDAGGGAGWGRARGHRGTASKRSHLLVLAQGFFSAKLRAHFTHHSPSTHKSHHTHSIYNTYSVCVHLSVFNKWVSLGCVFVSVCIYERVCHLPRKHINSCGGTPIENSCWCRSPR